MAERRLSKSGSHGREHGFTLIELLVAITVLGLMSLLIFSGLRFGSQAWARAGEFATERAKIEAAQSLLRRQLTRAYPAFADRDPTSHTIIFTGAPNRVEFISPLPRALNPGVMARIGIGLRGSEVSRALAMSWHLDLPASSSGSDAANKDVILLDGVKQIDFSYFGRGNQGDAPTWQSTWIGRSDLPALIRIRVQLADERASNWPELYVPLAIAANTDCVFDPVQRECNRQ
jgi:general secretion pathway protein J